FVTSADKFARAVERVDQEIVGADAGPYTLGLFFRDDRPGRRRALETMADDGLRRLVGRRDRGAVGLDAERTTLPVLEDGVRRGDADRGQRLQQIRVCGDVGTGHGAP